MDGYYKTMLRKGLGHDKKAIEELDNVLYDDYLNIMRMIDEYNENVRYLNSHASIANINQYDLKCRTIK